MKRLFTSVLLALLVWSGIADAQTPLRQSTSRVVRICGAVAVGDGFTPVTTLALGTADEAEALRDNTATLDISAATFTAITGADGCYSLTLDATATNTVGELVVVIQDDSLILPIKRTFQVVEESVYDNLYAAAAVGPLTAAQVNAEADTALTDYDPPTNTELNARTLLAASYFDPAADPVATVTNLTNLPSIPANWLTAAGISAGALNGKGDWNIGKTGYTLSQAFPANFSSLSIDGSGRIDVGSVAGTAQTANDNGADINAILTDTGTTLEGHLTDIKGGTFSGATDSLEAIRDRGDAAWTTGSGTGLTAIASGTAVAATSTTLDLAAGETFADDELIGAVVQITGGSTGVGQSRCITDNAATNDRVTVAAWTTTPTGTITYEIAPSLGGECPLSTAASGATELNLTANGNIGIDWANVENATSTVGLSGTTVSTVSTLTGHTVQTGDSYARLGAPAGASIAADIAALNDPSAAAIVSALLSESCAAPGAGTIEEQLCSDLDDVLADTNALETRVTATRADNLDVLEAERTAFLNCEVNTANFAGSTTTLACILTDIDGGAVTQATGDLEGWQILVTSGDQIREGRHINDTTWDAANSELQLTLSRPLPATLADAVTAVIR